MQIKDIIPWARGSDAPETKGGEKHPLQQLQEEMNRAFENFWSQVNQSIPGFAKSETGASGPGTPTTGSMTTLGFPWSGASPSTDVVETEEGIEITLELPGLDQKDVEVSLTDDFLTVKGEKKVEREDKKKGYYLSERSYGAFRRAIPLPPGVDSVKAEAVFRNGVLTVKLPQSAEAKAKVRRIDVKAG